MQINYDNSILNCLHPQKRLEKARNDLRKEDLMAGSMDNRNQKITLYE